MAGHGDNPGGPWWPLFPGPLPQRGKAAEGLGWGSSGGELMPHWGRNSRKQAGDVSPIIPAAPFGWNYYLCQGFNARLVWVWHGAELVTPHKGLQVHME